MSRFYLLPVVLSTAYLLLVYQATQTNLTGLLEQSERAYLDGRFVEVERLSREILLLRPGHTTARVLLKEVQLVLGHRPFQSEDYSRYWESKFGVSRTQGFQIVLNRADVAIASGDFLAAEEDLWRALGSLHESRDRDMKVHLTRSILASLRRLSAR